MSLLGSARDMIKEERDYHVKLFRLFDPEPKLMWEGSTRFHIQRRPNGDIGVITPLAYEWAEYCQEDMELDESGYINLVCEDYLMVIT